MDKGGELIVLANEWWMMVREHDGLRRSDGRGLVNSKNSWASAVGDFKGLRK